MNFVTVDWTIVVAYLGASLLIGLLGSKYVGNTAHFRVAGENSGTYIGIATLAATESFAGFAAFGLSAVGLLFGSLLGKPAKVAVAEGELR
jgi:Na+/proline symporter